MKYRELNELESLPFFTTDDVACVLGVKKESARVFCSRRAKEGIFLRLKKDVYVSAANWGRYGEADFFRIANFLQVPSYISCTTALSFHGVTTQVQRNWCESVSLKRSVSYMAYGWEFHYHKFMKPLYFGFEKMGNCFIAGKEKALIDAAHLTSLGLYSLDEDSLNIERMDREICAAMVAPFPVRTRNLVRRICRI
jgi:hypothetical protein